MSRQTASGRASWASALRAAVATPIWQSELARNGWAASYIDGPALHRFLEGRLRSRGERPGQDSGLQVVHQRIQKAPANGHVLVHRIDGHNGSGSAGRSCGAGPVHQGRHQFGSQFPQNLGTPIAAIGRAQLEIQPIDADQLITAWQGREYATELGQQEVVGPDHDLLLEPKGIGTGGAGDLQRRPADDMIVDRAHFLGPLRRGLVFFGFGAVTVSVLLRLGSEIVALLLGLVMVPSTVAETALSASS